MDLNRLRSDEPALRPNAEDGVVKLRGGFVDEKSTGSVCVSFLEEEEEVVATAAEEVPLAEADDVIAEVAEAAVAEWR